MAMPKRDEMLKARGVVRFQCDLKEVLKSVGKGVVKSVGKILKLLGDFPEITRESLAAEVGLSVRGVEKNLAQLKSAGKIRRVGGRKGGRWEVVNGGGK